MKNLLCVVGMITILIGVILGLSTMYIEGSLLAGVIIVASAIAGALIYFALAEIIENQEKILKQETSNPMQHPLLGGGHSIVIGCEHCGKEYTSDRRSCPYCGKING